MSTASTTYRGRFAPSPTGPLHLGSLIAALASYLDAKSRGGQWLVRMEDLDPPREQAGAAYAILYSLEAHALQWDESVMWQSQRHGAYRDALDLLRADGHLFHCDCTRAMLGAGGACNGRCQGRQSDIAGPAATRVMVDPAASISFDDAYQGPQQCALGADLADFTLLRKDGLFAYQLAVVVDDAAQAITHVHRGSDLLDSTARQRYLQQLLGYALPEYGHFPVITRDGQKFSKQNHAPALHDTQAADNLRAALRFLRQPATTEEAPTDLLAQAISQWQPARVPRQLAVAAEPALYPSRGLA